MVGITTKKSKVSTDYQGEGLRSSTILKISRRKWLRIIGNTVSYSVELTMPTPPATSAGTMALETTNSLTKRWAPRASKYFRNLHRSKKEKASTLETIASG